MMDPPNQLEAANVPVFTCIIYVSRAEGGGVRARVANLAGFECTAGSEREALMKLVPAFKERIRELLQNATEIPWIEPRLPKEPDEQERAVPVHL
jgi:hypothetical protein